MENESAYQNGGGRLSMDAAEMRAGYAHLEGR
jgi:hypothetical protein